MGGVRDGRDKRRRGACFLGGWAGSIVAAVCPLTAFCPCPHAFLPLPLAHLPQENCTFFYDALGGCERLLRTPIPVSYTR